jgi:hypothetical protein
MNNKDLQEDKYICFLQENLSYNNIFTNIQRFFVVHYFSLGRFKISWNVLRFADKRELI